MDIHQLFIYASTLVLTCICVADGHGGMTEPPMRSVAWKYGFDTPVNYDWNALYCGGLNVFTQNNGRCGLCGDPYTGPFENNKGGIYDTGVIVRHYPAGLREIEVKVEITAHHKGYFQFKLCPNNAEELTQECLDRHLLMIREGRTQGDPTRYYPPKEPKLNELHVRLPEGIICDRCVLQWTYTAGNNIGREIQETFVNCADISIGGRLDRIPVPNKQHVDGDIVVIGQRPNITQLIDRAPPGSLREVLSALTGSQAGSGNLHPVSRDGTFGEGRGRMQGGFRPDSTSRVNNNNRDPRMLIPPVNENPNHSPLSSNLDKPGHLPDIGSTPHLPRNSGTNKMVDMMARDWMAGDSMIDHGMFRPNVPIGSPQWRNSFLDRSFQIGSVPQNIPPPSQVWSGDHFPAERNIGIINDKGSHNTLLSSVGSVVGQIRKDNSPKGGKSVQNRRPGTVPNEFVQQMTELRRAFPNSHEWRRGDGRWSQNHAVRQNPMLDTHEFTTAEIGHLVPSLPSNIGPRQDIQEYNDPRFSPGMMHFRNNWFPGSQYLMQQQRMRIVNNQLPVTITRLPRRIEVHSMAVAQHLLRKYPQLRGRVFLSRQGHVRNKFGHMMHKYARRRNWSRV